MPSESPTLEEVLWAILVTDLCFRLFTSGLKALVALHSLRLLLTAVAVIVLSKILPGVQVVDFTSAIIIAVVLAILNAVLKPILVILTFPITVVTLGLFLLAINAGIIMLADYLLDGFAVSGFWIALLFSLLLSLMQSVLYSLLDKDIKQS